MSTTKNYSVTIEGAEFSHTLDSYSNKSDAIKRAVTVKHLGSFWTDELKAYDRANSTVNVYDAKNSETIYTEKFTLKYISRGKI